MKASSTPHPRSLTAQITAVILFNFICYLAVGIPLAVLPTFVHDRLGFSPLVAGLVISTQYLATFLTRPSAGRMVDTYGPRQTVLYGLFACALSGLALLAGATAVSWPLLSLALLFASRLFLGWGESFVATGATIWGIARVGASHTALVISWNGVATYGAIALGAPLGILLREQFGFVSIGIAIVSVALLSVPVARKKQTILPPAGKMIPIRQVFRKVMPYGLGLAFGSLGFGTIATFITLYYAREGWQDPALALTAFGIVFVSVRLIGNGTINRFGGARVAIVCFIVETIGLILLGNAASTPWALIGVILTGMGFSLVFPALGVEAVACVGEVGRGAALGLYSVFTDVALGITGLVGGMIAEHYDFPAVYQFAAGATVVAAMITVSVVVQKKSSASKLVSAGIS